ncbi:N-6 DNA methylase [Stenomitos frigidus]|uniref:site-specific DNA-methyltransferase (adenine-specific) n=1 Tax=Stenomitos frigidus ULC18 TaxID=2107698 RepID=A0A2T1E358_9CYAN|nr:N-6 DNA methylase [Stenomitos frigidus]PSB27054.1 hypothetical protein C7B82_18080 [Stenomitos frigidus ULC18]
MASSPNFEFLHAHDAQLVRLGSLAEWYFADDPNTCLIKLRQFGEVLAQLTAAKVGLYVDAEEKQVNLLRRLRDRGVLKGEVDRLFHELRKAGNDATHELAGNQRTALSGLKYARALGIWFHRVFTHDRTFDPGSFIPPPEPHVETQALKAELAQLRKEVYASLSKVDAAEALAQAEAQRRLEAEALAQEAAAQVQAFQTRLAQVQTQADRASEQELKQTIAQAQVAETHVSLDERETRRLIDAQLRAAGWDVDSEVLTYTSGTRPQKGKNLAIAEFPTAEGRADYALFVGLQVVAVVEAKRQSKDVSVLPDNVLFEDGQGRSIRADLMDKCNLHTILRLPTGIFYAQGVKTNVLFFQRGTTEKGNTKQVWIYDMRTNMPAFGKRTPLTREHFRDFGQCYGNDPQGSSPRVDQGEEGRFRCFLREAIAKRGENLDLSWLRDESLQSGDDLPEPEVIATEIMEKLRLATKEMESLLVLLEGEEAPEAVSASVGLPIVE